MRVKADHDLAALREGPAGHSSGAVGPIADVRSRRFPECLLVFPTDIDRRPDEMLQGPLFRVRRASTPIEPIPFPVLLFKIPRSSKSNSLFRCAGNFSLTLRMLSNSRLFLGLGKRFREIACFFP